MPTLRSSEDQIGSCTSRIASSAAATPLETAIETIRLMTPWATEGPLANSCAIAMDASASNSSGTTRLMMFQRSRVRAS